MAKIFHAQAGNALSGNTQKSDCDLNLLNLSNGEDIIIISLIS